MKERMKRILACVGTVGVMTIAFSVPAMADTTGENTNIDTEGTQAQGIDWSDKAAANVFTYANVRKGTDVNTERVGRVPSGGVVTILGEENGWYQISSGEVEGYIWSDLLVSGADAQRLFEAMYGSSELVGAEPIHEAVNAAQAQAAAEAAAQAQAEASAEAARAAEAAELNPSEEEIQAAAQAQAEAEAAAQAQAEAEAAAQAAAEAEAAAQAQAEAEAAAQAQAEAEAAAQAEAEAQEAAAGVSSSDLDLMAAIIECEAGGESYEGKIGVGAVIMNRIRSSEFPNNLTDVIYQSGQFSPVASGKLASVLNRGARQDCYDAARDVFAGANTIGDCLFFHAGGGNGLTIGNQTFY